MINISELGTRNENIEITVTDVTFGIGEVKLNGRLLYPEVTGEVPGVVLCHGFGTNYRTVEQPARMIAGYGIAVLIFDFRGHGKSDGFVDENIVGDVIDAWNFLSGCPGIDKERIGLAGHSMGALAAILASREIKPRALIALSCPPEIDGDISRLSFEVPLELLKEQKMINEYPRDGSLPWVKGLAGIISQVWMRVAGYKVRVDWSKFFNIFSRAKLSTAIKELEDCAMLFVHCTGDSIAPCRTAVALYETAEGPKELLLAEGGFHSTPLLAGRIRNDWTEWMANTLRSL
ncbi:MAG: alpha/beta fold hydrolase [Dehalococcoidia bacterium]|nr:alpha/beta fold hydrolase [Dehalococcoidia bacterium]MDD5493107.1 alpha/beta fold hydrolase [Dehalococcoidia bacterium]